MARYEITAPDGSRHEITAPDDATEAQVMAYAQQSFSKPAAPAAKPAQKPESNTIRDTLAGIGMSAADVVNTAAQGIGLLIPDSLEQAAGDALGMAGSATEAARNQQQAFQGITNDSTAGKVGRFVGNVAATAPASGLRVAGTLAKVAPKLAKAKPFVDGAVQGAASGLALSSANPDVGAGAQAGIGGVVGGAVAGALPYGIGKIKRTASTLVNGAGKEQTMSRAAEQLASKAHALYSQADEAGVMFKQEGIRKVSTRVKQLVGRPNTILRPKTAGMMQELDDMAAEGTVSLSRLDELRQSVGKMMKNAEPDDARTLQVIKNQLDDFGDNATPDVVTGDYKNGMELIKEARKAWAMKSKAQILDDVFEKAENNTSQFTQSQYLGTVLQKFRQLANDKRRMRSFSKEEQDQITQIVRGGTADKVLRLLGKFSPTGVISGGVSGAAIASGGALGLAVPIIGAGAKHAATQSTRAAVRSLEDLILQGQVPQAIARTQPMRQLPPPLQMLMRGDYLPQPAPVVAGLSALSNKGER